MNSDNPFTDSQARTWQHLDDVIQAFEDAWRSGQRPVIEDHLGGPQSMRGELLSELAHVDLEWRLKAGESARAEEYLARYAELSDDPETAAELLAGEFRLRRRSEPDLTAKHYLVRFPQYEAALRQRFADQYQPQTGPGTTPDTSRGLALIGPELNQVATLSPASQQLGGTGDRLPRPGGYDVQAVLGRGGMGVVYRARQVNLDRVVALKMIVSGAHAGPEERDRFLAEARAVAAVRHPNVVQVYEVGQHDGLPYMALEYVAGGSLNERLKRGLPQPREAACLVEQLSRGIQAAHDRQIVHRDLKPQNVLLGLPEGSCRDEIPLGQCVPKVTDFGLAKRVEGGSALTQSGALMGTPAYMAPEQARGQGKRVGRAVDVYALGAILYECLTGRPPFHGPSAWDTMVLVASTEPVPVRQLQPGVPCDLETICMKCLVKEPEKRYSSATALAEDLRRFQAGEPIVARPASWLERVVKWARRRPATAALLVVSALLVVAVAVGAVSLFYRGELEAALDRAIEQTQIAGAERAEADRQRQAAEIQRDRAHSAQTEAEQARDRARQAEAEKENQRRLAEERGAEAARYREQAELLLYARQLALAQAEWETNNVRTARDLLDRCRWDLRGWEHCYLDALFQRGQQHLHGHTDRVNSVAFSPDGKRLATCGGGADRTAKVWDVAKGALLFSLTGHSKEVRRVVYSPDGQRLATFSDDRTVRVWNAVNGNQLLVFQPHNGFISGLVYSPDGKQLATSGSDRMIKVWDSATGAAIHTLKGHAGAILCLAMSSDGKRLASGSDDHTVRVWDPIKGNELVTFKGHTLTVNAVTFSPDGRRVASAGEDKVVKVWDADTGTEVYSLKGHQARVGNVRYSPTGKHLASVSNDQVVKIWDALTGETLHTIQGPACGFFCLAFDPEGTRIASGGTGGVAAVWDVHTGKDLLILRGHTGTVYGMVFSPDGKRLASSGQDNLAIIWDTDSASPAKTAPIIGSSAAWRPDGKRLAIVSSQGVDVRDVETGRLCLSIKDNMGVSPVVAYSPDGKRLACSCGNPAGADKLKEVKIWDAEIRAEPLVLRGHLDWITCIAFSADGQLLATASQDQTVKVWNAHTGRELHTLTGHHRQVSSVAFNPTNHRLASAGWDSSVKVWDGETGKEVWTLTGHTSFVSAVAFSPNGSTLASASHDGTIRLWDAHQGTPTLTLKGPPREVVCLAFSPDGKRLASGDQVPRFPGLPGELKIWDPGTGTELLTLKGLAGAPRFLAFSPDGNRISSADLMGMREWDAGKERHPFSVRCHTRPVRCLAYSPDGRRLITGSWDDTVIMWDPLRGQELFPIIAHEGGVMGVAFHPDGKRFASCGADKQVKVWDAATGKELLSFRGHSSAVNSVMFSPDGRHVASASGNLVKVWGAETGKEILSLERHKENVSSVAYSPDGKRLASASADSTVKVWDTETGAELCALAGDTGPVTGLAFSPDGRLITSASVHTRAGNSGELRVWDPNKGTQLQCILVKTPLNGVAVSPDGKEFVAATGDLMYASKILAEVKSWDAETGAERWSLKGHTGSVLCVTYSPDGKRVASGGVDNTLKVWTVPSRLGER
jgi:WD40 repeat protein